MRANCTFLALLALAGCAEAPAASRAPAQPASTALAASVGAAAPAAEPSPTVKEGPVTPAPAGVAPPADSSPTLVMPGGTRRPIGPVAVSFATYLNKVHNRIHPEFADKELTAMDALPKSDPVNDPKLGVRIEVVLEGATGSILNEATARASGVPAFDARALAALRRAAPFGESPSDIRSDDGNVYMRWEFRRNEVFACTTINTVPYLFTRATQGP